jgi:DNA-binding NarL/FixJ family response regulator
MQTLATAAQSVPDGLYVLVVDDNRVVRDALAGLLVGDSHVRRVTSTGLGSETLQVIEEARPDLVLLPAVGQPTIDLTRAITRRFADARVVILGMKEAADTVTEAVEAGAAGYVPENASVEEFLEVIRLVSRGETRVPPQIAASIFSRLASLAAARRASDRARDIKLTPREIEILRLVAEGLTNKEIAARLHVEHQTIKNHIHNILERLSLQRRQQAVQYAWETGLLRRA